MLEAYHSPHTLRNMPSPIFMMLALCTAVTWGAVHHRVQYITDHTYHYQPGNEPYLLLTQTDPPVRAPSAGIYQFMPSGS